MDKTCFKCGGEKPLADFYTHPRMADGHLNKCKECTKKDSKRSYETQRSTVQEYDKRREARPERRRAKRRYQQAARKRHPERFKARAKVNNAIRDGKLERKPCQQCGTTLRVQAHHADYTKPFEVEWLCFPCHRQEHGQVVG